MKTINGLALVLASLVSSFGIGCAHETSSGEQPCADDRGPDVVKVIELPPHEPPTTTIIVETRPAPSTDAGTPPAPSKTGCAASRYTWGDLAMFVCANDLAFTRVVEGPFLAASFTFVNYYGIWNHVSTVCIRAVGDDGLEDVGALSFDWANSFAEPVMLKAPWPNDGHICVLAPYTIGAKSLAQLTVHAHPSRLGGFVPGRSYRFEMTDSSDISLDYDPKQPVHGDFPQSSGTVEIVRGY
jgi:hypothetical protein